MWVIVVSNSIQEHRDNRISELVGEFSNNKYLSLRNGSAKYGTTLSFRHAKFFKKESGARKILDEFTNSDLSFKKTMNSKFRYVSEYYLSVYKLTKDEWDFVINSELLELDKKFQILRDNLLKKKNQYK
jgi:hypothetical protein